VEGVVATLADAVDLKATKRLASPDTVHVLRLTRSIEYMLVSPLVK